MAGVDLYIQRVTINCIGSMDLFLLHKLQKHGKADVESDWPSCSSYLVAV